MQRSPVTIISAQGDLDLRESGQVGKAIDELMERGQKHLVVECSRADWIDPLALGIFLARHHKLIHEGGALKFARTNQVIKGIFWKYGVDKIFESYDRIEDALVSFDDEWRDDRAEAVQ